jgi:hypothetical protein
MYLAHFYSNFRSCESVWTWTTASEEQTASIFSTLQPIIKPPVSSQPQRSHIILREEHILFDKRVLRRIFGHKKDEVQIKCRKLCSEKLHKLYSSPNIIRQMKAKRMWLVGHVARKGEERKVYRCLVGKPEEKRPLLRPRRRWEDGIKTRRTISMRSMREIKMYIIL